MTKVTIDDQYIVYRVRTYDWCQNQRSWMTLKGHYTLSFKRRASFGANHENLNEDRLHCQQQRRSAMTLNSGNLRFMRIFAVVLKLYVNFPFMPTPVYYVYTYLTLFSLSSSEVLGLLIVPIFSNRLIVMLCC